MKPVDQGQSILAKLFADTRAHFGDAVKSYWLYDRDICPGCGGEIDAIRYKGQEALSLNAFIYRKYGVLIGYLLCRRCAKSIFQAAEKQPMVQTPLHTTIEKSLSAAYERYRKSLPA